MLDGGILRERESFNDESATPRIRESATGEVIKRFRCAVITNDSPHQSLCSRVAPYAAGHRSLRDRVKRR
jgi:hypothetical protein